MSISTTSTWRVQVMGVWHLWHHGDEVAVPHRPRRMVALLALQGDLPRTFAAHQLWPASSESHAAANLRTTVVELRRRAPGLVLTSTATVGLTADLGSDLQDLTEVLGGSAPPGVLAQRLGEAAILLPGWEDDWVLEERYRLQLRMVEAAMSEVERLLEVEELAAALTLARLVTRLEPNRESAHRSLAAIHLLVGDRVQAWQVFSDFHARSVRDFGVGVSPMFHELIAPLVAERRARRSRPRSVLPTRDPGAGGQR